jgi:hypothetical protein
MARTFYKYAEKQADSQINWFQVGKDITDMLGKEVETREKKKAALDEASRKFGEELENAPQGNADDVNKWTTDFAGDMQSYRLMTDRLFKSGRLKEKNYTLIRQNTLDGTKNLFNLSKEYQAEYDDKQKRRMNGEASASETQFMAMVEGFANLNETKALINPTSGAISVGKMVAGKDGVKVLAEGPNNYMTVNQLRNRIKEKINKYQLNDELEAETKLMGDVVKEAVTKTGSSTETGFMTKITDQTLRKGLSQEGQQAVDAYIGLENKIVQAKLSNSFNTSSILFDWTGGVDPKTGKPYQVTLDPKEAESSTHFVLWTYKKGVFQPDFESTANGREQYKNAEDYTKKKLRGMLEQKTEVEPFFQPRKEYAPSYVYERGDAARIAQNAGNMLGKLYSGTAAEVQSASDYFYGLPNVRTFKRNADGITLVTTNGVVKDIPFKNADGSLKTKEDFIRSATSLLLGKDADVANVVKGSLNTTSNVFNADASTESTAESNDPSVLYGKYVTESITDLPKIEEEAVPKLNPILSKIGFEAEEAVGGEDYIVIKSTKDKKIVSPNIKLDDPEAIKNIQGFLLSNIPGAKMEDKAFFLSNLMKTGVFDEQMKKPTKTTPTNQDIKNRIGGY